MGFKPKDDTLRRITELQTASFSQEQFVRQVFRDEYMLVVGSEVMLNRAFEPSGDVKRYILKMVNEILGRQYANFNDLTLRSGEMMDPVRSLLLSEDFSYDLSDITPELDTLLRTRLFRYVLTTTFDGYLETLLRDIWGEELRVVNINDDDSLKDFRKELELQRGNRMYVRPTLIYVFGKAVADVSKKYVKTDDDAIQIIEKWINLGDEDRILTFMRSKRLLALGCKFDDWYFRFFWYILRRGKGNKNERRILCPGEAAIVLDETDRSDKQLSDYLRHTSIQTLGDARAFMASTSRLLTESGKESPLRNLIVQQRRKGGVFLSYCSADATFARQLFFRLAQRYDVWFDNVRLAGGDEYEHEIDEAIAQCRVFLPLLTPHVAADLARGDVSHYYNKEWQIARQWSKPVIPVAVNGYDLRSPYHTLFEETVGNRVSGVDLMALPFDSLVDAIDKQLNLQQP